MNIRKGFFGLAWVFLVCTFILFPAAVFAAEKEVPPPVVRMDMTLEELAAQNGVDIATLSKGLQVPDNPVNRKSSLATLQLSETQVREVVRKAMVLSAEEGSKDWKKILLKFVLWGTVVGAGIWLLVKNRVTPRLRIGLLAGAVLVFGVYLGSDPSPMGTVKDAVVLFGAERTIFPPRIIAFAVFTAMVVIGNKMICGWGCQFGALQDLIYQISPMKKRVKLPFALSNAIRLLVFVAAMVAAFAGPFDLIGAVDPFKIYAPSHLALLSGGFILVLLASSLFIYRPWCTLACPFGLTGWIFERYSWFRVRLDRSKCISCGACRRACPSQHMNGLQDAVKHPGDCYSCAACLKVCPVGALRYARK